MDRERRERERARLADPEMARTEADVEISKVARLGASHGKLVFWICRVWREGPENSEEPETHVVLTSGIVDEDLVVPVCEDGPLEALAGMDIGDQGSEVECWKCRAFIRRWCISANIPVPDHLKSNLALELRDGLDEMKRAAQDFAAAIEEWGKFCSGPLLNYFRVAAEKVSEIGKEMLIKSLNDENSDSHVDAYEEYLYTAVLDIFFISFEEQSSIKEWAEELELDLDATLDGLLWLYGRNSGLAYIRIVSRELEKEGIHWPADEHLRRAIRNSEPYP